MPYAIPPLLRTSPPGTTSHRNRRKDLAVSGSSLLGRSPKSGFVSQARVEKRTKKFSPDPDLLHGYINGLGASRTTTNDLHNASSNTKHREANQLETILDDKPTVVHHNSFTDIHALGTDSTSAARQWPDDIMGSTKVTTQKEWVAKIKARQAKQGIAQKTDMPRTGPSQAKIPADQRKLDKHQRATEDALRRASEGAQTRGDRHEEEREVLQIEEQRKQPEAKTSLEQFARQKQRYGNDNAEKGLNFGTTANPWQISQVEQRVDARRTRIQNGAVQSQMVEAKQYPGEARKASRSLQQIRGFNSIEAKLHRAIAVSRKAKSMETAPAMHAETEHRDPSVVDTMIPQYNSPLPHPAKITIDTVSMSQDGPSSEDQSQGTTMEDVKLHGSTRTSQQQGNFTTSSDEEINENHPGILKRPSNNINHDADSREPRSKKVRWDENLSQFKSPSASFPNDVTDASPAQNSGLGVFTLSKRKSASKDAHRESPVEHGTQLSAHGFSSTLANFKSLASQSFSASESRINFVLDDGRGRKISGAPRTSTMEDHPSSSPHDQPLRSTQDPTPPRCPIGTTIRGQNVESEAEREKNAELKSRAYERYKGKAKESRVQEGSLPEFKYKPRKQQANEFPADDAQSEAPSDRPTGKTQEKQRQKKPETNAEMRKIKNDVKPAAWDRLSLPKQADLAANQNQDSANSSFIYAEEPDVCISNHADDVDMTLDRQAIGNYALEHEDDGTGLFVTSKGNTPEQDVSHDERELESLEPTFVLLDELETTLNPKQLASPTASCMVKGPSHQNQLYATDGLNNGLSLNDSMKLGQHQPSSTFAADAPAFYNEPLDDLFEEISSTEDLLHARDAERSHPTDGAGADLSQGHIPNHTSMQTMIEQRSDPAILLQPAASSCELTEPQIGTSNDSIQHQIEVAISAQHAEAHKRGGFLAQLALAPASGKRSPKAKALDVLDFDQEYVAGQNMNAKLCVSGITTKKPASSRSAEQQKVPNVSFDAKRKKPVRKAVPSGTPQTLERPKASKQLTQYASPEAPHASNRTQTIHSSSRQFPACASFSATSSPSSRAPVDSSASKRPRNSDPHSKKSNNRKPLPQLSSLQKRHRLDHWAWVEIIDFLEHGIAAPRHLDFLRKNEQMLRASYKLKKQEEEEYEAKRSVANKDNNRFPSTNATQAEPRQNGGEEDSASINLSEAEPGLELDSGSIGSSAEAVSHQQAESLKLTAPQIRERPKRRDPNEKWLDTFYYGHPLSDHPVRRSPSVELMVHQHYGGKQMNEAAMKAHLNEMTIQQATDDVQGTDDGAVLTKTSHPYARDPSPILKKDELHYVYYVYREQWHDWQDRSEADKILVHPQLKRDPAFHNRHDAEQAIEKEKTLLRRGIACNPVDMIRSVYSRDQNGLTEWLGVMPHAYMRIWVERERQEEGGGTLPDNKNFRMPAYVWMIEAETWTRVPKVQSQELNVPLNGRDEEDDDEENETEDKGEEATRIEDKNEKAELDPEPNAGLLIRDADSLPCTETERPLCDGHDDDDDEDNDNDNDDDQNEQDNQTKDKSGIATVDDEEEADSAEEDQYDDYLDPEKVHDRPRGIWLDLEHANRVAGQYFLNKVWPRECARMDVVNERKAKKREIEAWCANCTEQGKPLRLESHYQLSDLTWKKIIVTVEEVVVNDEI